MSRCYINILWSNFAWRDVVQVGGMGGLRWAIVPEHVHHWRNILSCTAKISKHLLKKNIGLFILTKF